MRLAPRLVLTALSLAALPLSGCAPVDAPLAPHRPPLGAAPVDAPALAAVAPATPGGAPGTPTEVRRPLLKHAAPTLTYTSESDYPFTYVFVPALAPTPLTVEAFRQALALPPDTPVETVSLDDFFARHIERVDPYDAAAVALVPRYRVLRETIRHAVRAPRVYRVGRIVIDCHVVGTDHAGNVVGLRTVAIET